MMDPSQSLGESFFVNVEKCFLCTGVDGYIPKYDPEHSEYGCVTDSSNLLHAFKIIDKGAPRSVTTEFRNIPFNAVLARDDTDKEVKALLKQPNADGFRFDSAPLFQVSYGRQWFVHCIYTVRSKDKATRGIGKRSISSHQLNTKSKRSLTNDIDIGVNGRGTNMNRLVLDYSSGGKDSKKITVSERKPSSSVSRGDSAVLVVVIGVFGSLIIMAVTVLFLSKKERRDDSSRQSQVTRIVSASPGTSRIVSLRNYNLPDDHTEV